MNNFKKSTAIERDLLIEVARTSLRTKLELKLADHITECVVDAILTIRKSPEDYEPDLFMIEIQVFFKQLILNFFYRKWNMKVIRTRNLFAELF